MEDQRDFSRQRNEEMHSRQNEQPGQSFGGTKIEDVEWEKEVPSRLLSLYDGQELYSCSHISFTLVLPGRRGEKQWSSFTACSDCIAESGRADSLMLMFSLSRWMVRSRDQQAQGLEFTLDSTTYCHQLQPKGEHCVCVSETIFSFSLEYSPCVWKMIFKSLESNGIGLGRKEVYLRTQDLFHFASCSQISWSLFILGLQTTCWGPYYLV